MPTISEIRQQYPQYNDLSDQQLTDALYQKHYSDMPREEFDMKIGGDATQPQDPDEIVARGELLPVGRTRGGELAFPVMPGFLQGPQKTVTDLMEGRRQAQDITGGEVLGLGAVLAGPMTPAYGSGAAIARMGLGRNAPHNFPQPPPPPGAGPQVAAASERIGVPLPQAVSSDSMLMQRAGQLSQKVPFGGGPLTKASQKAISGLGTKADEIIGGLGSGERISAGEAMMQGLKKYVGPKTKEKVGAAYDKVDALVDDTIPTYTQHTKDVAEAIATERAASKLQGRSEALNQVAAAIEANEGMTYSGIKGLRTTVGELLDNNLLPASVSKSELKRIYGALSDDLRAAVTNAGGPAALRAFERANKYNKLVQTRRENLMRIVGAKSEEQVFERLAAAAKTSSRGDIKLLKQARRAVGQDAWPELASAVVAKLGRDAEGNFSAARFVGPQGWSGLTREGKAELFAGNRWAANALDDIATVSSRFKQLEQYANPSGTGQILIGGASAAGLVMDPITTLSTVVGANMTSRILARPSTVRAASQWAKAYQRAMLLPNQATKQALGIQSQRLGLIISKEFGVPNVSEQLQAIAGEDQSS